MATVIKKSLVLSTPVKEHTGYRSFDLYVDQYDNYYMEGLPVGKAFSKRAAKFVCSDSDKACAYFHSILSFYEVKDYANKTIEYPESFVQYLYSKDKCYAFQVYYDKRTSKMVGCYNEKIFFSAKTVYEFSKKSYHIVTEEDKNGFGYTHR